MVNEATDTSSSSSSAAANDSLQVKVQDGETRHSPVAGATTIDNASGTEFTPAQQAIIESLFGKIVNLWDVIARKQILYASTLFDYNNSSHPAENSNNQSLEELKISLNSAIEEYRKQLQQMREENIDNSNIIRLCPLII